MESQINQRHNTVRVFPLISLGSPRHLDKKWRSRGMCARHDGKPSEVKRGIKIRLILLPPGGGKSEIKLIRTDTTLDLSQKAEKVWRW